MQPSPVNSFLRFLVGFLTFISVSFGLTYAVSKYTVAQSQAQHAAALEAALLKSGK